MAEAIQVNWQNANYNGQFHNRSFSFIKIKPHFNGLLFFRARSEQQYNLFYSKLSAATPDSFLPAFFCVCWCVDLSHSLKHCSSCEILVEPYFDQKGHHEVFPAEVCGFSFQSFLIGPEAGKKVGHQLHLLFWSK